MAILITTDGNCRQRWLRVTFWLIAIALGALYAWDARHLMNGDGLSYLDMGDAYVHGHWNLTINTLWSPLYAWILGLALLVLNPSPYWEFSIVHLVNFAIYLCALGCFDFFLRELIRYHREQKAVTDKDGFVTLPEWTWQMLGYILFLWSSLSLIGVSGVIPDMCVAALVYLASGILLRIRRQAAGWPAFVLLGLVLGFGYLAKAPMFLLAFVFLMVSMFSVGNLRRAAPRVLAAAAVFLLVGGPFIIALSKTKGRLTVGDSGKLNYIWHVNGIPSRHWQGGSSSGNTPEHPTRKISDIPAIYEFGNPVGGTYPPWYDPSYWYEGVNPHFGLSEQMKALVVNARLYYQLLFSMANLGLIVGLLILLYTGRKKWRMKYMAEHWSLLIPALVAMVMYLPVHMETRYIGAFVVLLWLGLFSSVRLPDDQRSIRILALVIIITVIPMANAIGLTPTHPKAYSAVRAILKREEAPAHIHWQVAECLHRIGVQPGDKVAVIWPEYLHVSPNPYWARLARVKVIADMPIKDRSDSGLAGHEVESQTIEIFAKTGAKVIVAEKLPDYVSTTGWQRLGDTDFYAYLLMK